MTDRTGQQLGNYQLLRMIGTGGFAEVYLAEHKYLRTNAAIKLLHARLASSDEEFFLNEARIIAHLIHPHIIRVLEFGVEDATPFLVMDYAPNGTLRQHHPKGSRVSLPTVISYVKQIAEVLDYAHSQKVIHRDIKPENMLVGPKNTLLLSDFGIAQVAQSSRLQSDHAVAGTIAYMAPEQISATARIASDQYALGIVVYEWLTGERPFSGSFTEIAVKHNLVPPSSFYQKVPGLPRAVEDVVMTALAKDPQQRFAQVGAFARALEQASMQVIANSSAPTIQAPLGLPYASATVFASPVQIPNPVTPHPFDEAATIMSEPNIVSGRMTPPQQAMNEIVLPVVASNRGDTPPVTRRGSSRGRMLLMLGLLLFVIAGSTGIFFAVFANKGGANNLNTTKSSLVAKPTIAPADSINAQDTFQRPDQQFWGVASDGQSWKEEANSNTAFSITNKTGQLAQANGAVNALLGGKRNNEEVVFSGSINHFGQGVNIGLVLRWTDEADWYKAFIDGQNLVIIKRVAGKTTTIGSVSFNTANDTLYSLRFRVLGTTLSVKAWQSNQHEPAEWMLTGADNSFATVQGFGGLRFSIHTDNIVKITAFSETRIHPAAA